MQGFALESRSSLAWDLPEVTNGPRSGRAVFSLFLLLNLVLYVRPADIVPAVERVPFYLLLIIPCILLSLPVLGAELKPATLAKNPISICVIGMVAAVFLSLVCNSLFAEATSSGFEFVKLIAYYLLFVGLVNSAERLRTTMYVLVGFVTFIAMLTLFQFHGLINIEALAPLQDKQVAEQTLVTFTRLRGPGCFYDPNDFCHILAVAAIIAIHGLTDLRFKAKRFLWVIPLGILLYTIVLTQSRGGFIALLAGIGVMFVSRFGVKKAMMLAVLGAPLLLVASGRQLQISTEESTGQERIQIWADAIGMFKGNPVFGGGEDQFKHTSGFVPHNSFIQCYAELGFLGGTLFLGAWWLAFRGVNPLPGRGIRPIDPTLAELRSTVGGVIAAYMVGMLTLSRCYVVPTYTILGVAAVYNLLSIDDVGAPPTWRKALVRKAIVMSFVFIFVMECFVRWSVRF